MCRTTISARSGSHSSSLSSKVDSSSSCRRSLISSGVDGSSSSPAQPPSAARAGTAYVGRDEGRSSPGEPDCAAARRDLCGTGGDQHDPRPLCTERDGDVGQRQLGQLKLVHRGHEDRLMRSDLLREDANPAFCLVPEDPGEFGGVDVFRCEPRAEGVVRTGLRFHQPPAQVAVRDPGRDEHRLAGAQLLGAHERREKYTAITRVALSEPDDQLAELGVQRASGRYDSRDPRRHFIVQHQQPAPDHSLEPGRAQGGHVIAQTWDVQLG